MYAVFRENTYPTDIRIERDRGFVEFQKKHADQPGYLGNMVVEAGDGRYLSITLWTSEADMKAARQALGPVVSKLLDPLMAAPSKLLGTGRVIVNDVMS